MRQTPREYGSIGIERWGRMATAIVVSVVLVACSGETPEEAEPAPVAPSEEMAVTEESIPAATREHATAIFERLGLEVHCREWSEDLEDGGYECAVVGLAHPVELDIEADGAFSEWEITLDEDVVREFAPVVFDMIAEVCGDVHGATFELSLREEALIDPQPDPFTLWGQDAVFLEIQCADGNDFEVDAFGSMVTTPDDDID